MYTYPPVFYEDHPTEITTPVGQGFFSEQSTDPSDSDMFIPQHALPQYSREHWQPEQLPLSLPNKVESTPLHPSPVPRPHRSTTRATLTKQETSRAVKHARDELLKITVTRGAIFGDNRGSEIKKAILKGLRSVVGGVEVEQPKTMRKDVVRCLNELLHAWKDYSLPYVLSALDLRPQYGQPMLPRTAVADRAKDLLNTFSFLRASPEEDYFTLGTFHQMIIHKVFECKPELWVHIDVNATHEAFGNLFSFGAAAIAANIRDYRLGTREAREVSLENWLLDYHHARELVEEIRRDVVRQAVLDNLQRWMMDLGMAIVTQTPVS
ncbi:hypothetical protein J3R83DRAFT_13981 [Lanmaoa asiatica]|nr:hypothetical protein J3R83DRAFT_13981 [Lanmaoa asiatica]